MKNEVIIFQLRMAVDPKIIQAVEDIGIAPTIIQLEKETLTVSRTTAATVVICDSWDKAAFSKWGFLVQDHPHFFWIGDAFTQEPTQCQHALKRPYSSEHLSTLLAPLLQSTGPKVLQLTSCTVDLQRHLVQHSSVSHTLTQQEVRLLEYFASRPGQIVTRNDLHQDVWDSHGEARGRAAAFAILRLRNKIEADAAHPKHILTVRGIGYRWEPLLSKSPPSPPAPADTWAPPLREHSTRFVGRKDALSQIHTLLDKGKQLVTLLGPGGTGKTRISLHLGLQLQRKNKKVLFVELESIKTEEAFIHQLSLAIECALEPEAQISERARHVGSNLALRQNFLLILDNFEQVDGNCALLVGEWLKMCPKLQLLVTSREPLKIQYETRIIIPPLQTAEAVELFVERGQAARLGFQMDETNRELIQETVKRLDYLPLAIELAAARLKILSIESLHTRLTNRLDMLVDRRRDHQGRQKTLRTTLDWSWNLLDENEKNAFMQCGIFHGGFSLQAAETIFVVPPKQSALDMIESLHEKSLIRAVEADADPEGLRFVMLEMVRDYASEKLRESGQFKDIKERHEAFYIQLATGLTDSLYSNQEALRQIQLEKANLIGIAENTENPDILVQCIILLDHILTQFGPFGLHVKLLNKAVDQMDRCSPALQVVALRARGRALRMRAQFNDAESDLRTSVEIAKKHQLQGQEGLAVNNLAALLWARVRVVQAYDYFHAALKIFEAEDNQKLIGVTLYQIAIMNMEMKRYKVAKELAKKSELVSRRVSNHYYAAMAIHIRGAVCMAEGDLLNAMDLFESSRKELASLGSQSNLASVEYDIGICRHLTGQVKEAIGLYHTAHRTFLTVKDRREQAHGYALLAIAYADTDQLMEATQNMDTSERLCRLIHDSRGLGCLEVARGHLELARAREIFAHQGMTSVVQRCLIKAEDRIQLPPVSGLTASCPSGIPLSEISQDVRWFTQLLKNAMQRTRDAIT